MDAARGLAAGIRAYLEAKVMVHQAKTEREKQLAQRLLDEKRVRLQERQYSLRERQYEPNKGALGNQREQTDSATELKDTSPRENEQSVLERQDKEKESMVKRLQERRTMADKAGDTAAVERIDRAIDRAYGIDIDAPSVVVGQTEGAEKRHDQNLAVAAEQLAHGQIGAERYYEAVQEAYGTQVEDDLRQRADKIKTAVEAGGGTWSPELETRTILDLAGADTAARDGTGAARVGKDQKTAKDARSHVEDLDKAKRAIVGEGLTNQEKDSALADYFGSAGYRPSLTGVNWEKLQLEADPGGRLGPDVHSALMQEASNLTFAQARYRKLVSLALEAQKAENPVDYALDTERLARFDPRTIPFLPIADTLNSSRPKTHRPWLEDSLDQAVTAARQMGGDESKVDTDEGQRYLLNKIYTSGYGGLSTADKNVFGASRFVLVVSNALRDTMKELQSKGVELNRLKGFLELVLLKGMSATIDPELREFHALLESVKTNFTRLRSGLALTDNERRLYDEIWPGIMSSYETGFAQLDSLRNGALINLQRISRDRILNPSEERLFSNENILHVWSQADKNVWDDVEAEVKLKRPYINAVSPDTFSQSETDQTTETGETKASDLRDQIKGVIKSNPEASVEQIEKAIREKHKDHLLLEELIKILKKEMSDNE